MKSLGILTKFAISALMLAMAANVILAYRDAEHMKLRLDNAQRELGSLRKRNDQMRQEIKALETDPRFVEIKIRQRDKLRDGEQLIEEK